MHPALLIPILGVSIPIVAIVSVMVVRPWLRLQARKLEIEADLARERMQVESARQERLEARVAVLERIVTDRGGVLADEIERLRDKPLN